MTIGLSLFLIAAGAVLSFAVNDTSVGPVDLYVVGIILMIVGVAGIVLGFVQQQQANRTPVRRPPAPGTRTEYTEEERIYRDRDVY